MRNDPISFWLSDDSAWIKPTGDACELNAGEVKEFAGAMIRRGTCDFIVDLKECSGMDDVFMGTLTGVALRLYEQKRGGVRLIGASPTLDEQLRHLGLDQLFVM